MTPASAECPIPRVNEALGPYVKSRHEVGAIREKLQQYLESRVSLDSGQALSTVNLERPPYDRLDNNPGDLTGVHRAYLNALRAHQSAKEKLDSLRAEIQAIGQQREEPSSAVKLADTPVNRNILPLIHQRERKRKLQVIERALQETQDAGGDAIDEHLDDLVKANIGEPPSLPTLDLSIPGGGSDVDERILDLKKAILVAKQDLDEVKKSNAASYQRSGPSSDDAELAALRQAHKVLVSWIEDKLAAIADAETASESNEEANTGSLGGEMHSNVASAQDIDALYQQYIASRRRLIHVSNNAPSENDLQTANAEPALSNGFTARTETDKPSPSVTVLPYLPQLTALKQEEASLSQQSSFMRRQLAGTESETDRLIARLADESHLVQPGASRGQEWRMAAAEASRATYDLVASRVQAGKKATALAETVFEEIHDLPSAIERVVEAS